MKVLKQQQQRRLQAAVLFQPRAIQVESPQPTPLCCVAFSFVSWRRVALSLLMLSFECGEFGAAG